MLNYSKLLEIRKMSLPVVLNTLEAHNIKPLYTYSASLKVIINLIKLGYTGVELRRVGLDIGCLSRGIYRKQVRHIIDSYGVNYSFLDPYNCVRSSTPAYLTALQLQLILSLTK